MSKILNTTREYREIEMSFDGIPIIARHYFRPPLAIHLKVDEGFARASGFATLEDLYKVEPMLRGVEWLNAEIFPHVAAIQQGNTQPKNTIN